MVFLFTIPELYWSYLTQLKKRQQLKRQLGRWQLDLKMERSIHCLLATATWRVKCNFNYSMVSFTVFNCIYSRASLNFELIIYFSFYSTFFATAFKRCIELPAQSRFSIAFPLVCGHFNSAVVDFCPEERTHIRDRALNCVNQFLEEMAKEARNLLFNISTEQSSLANAVRGIISTTTAKTK